MNATTLEAERESKNLKAKINLKNDQIEKLKNQYKDRNIALTQLKKDNVLMRQDLSTYEANAISHIDTFAKTKKIVSTIDIRLKRIDEAEEHDNPGFIDFLDDITINIKKLTEIHKEK